MPPTMFFGQSPSNLIKTGDALNEIFNSDRFNFIQISVAWIRRSGVEVISKRLRDFLSNENNWVNITFGCGFGGTSSEAIRELLRISSNKGNRLRLRANLQSSGTFHPKIYYAQQTNGNHPQSGEMAVAIGSSNLTGAALRMNNSESLLLLDSNDLSDNMPFYDIEDYIDNCNDESMEHIIRIKNQLGVDELLNKGFLSSERNLRKRVARTKKRNNRGKKRITVLRSSLGLPDLSTSTSSSSSSGSSSSSSSGSSSSSSSGSAGSASFGVASRLEMVLSANDVIGGQVPYALIPVDAQTFFPGVTLTASRVHPDAYFDVEFVGGTDGIFTREVRWWYHAGLREWRLNVRSRARRELNWGQDSILIITRLTSSTAAYRIEILSPTDSGYSTRFGALNSTSSKRVTAFP